MINTEVNTNHFRIFFFDFATGNEISLYKSLLYEMNYRNMQNSPAPHPE